MARPVRKRRDDYDVFALIANIISYLRRSRQDIQREKRTGEDTLSIQRNIMTKVLDDFGIPYDVEEEIGSGDKIETRPVFQDVLRRIENDQYNAIAVKEISRLGRGEYSDIGRIYDLIKNKRLFIITPFKIYDPADPMDLRQIRFELFIAKEELETTKERLNSAKFNLAAEGRWVIGSPPYGFKLNPNSTRLESHDEESPIVTMIYELYVYGIPQPDNSFKEVSFRAIANYLNRLGIPSPRKGQYGWSVSTISKMLKNPVYKGTLLIKNKRVGNKYYKRNPEDIIEVEDAHEAIISLELWNLAQKKINGRNLPHVKMDFSPCELAGLVVCDHCGKRMVRQYSVQKYKKKDGTESIYHKEFLWCTTNGCTFVKYRDVESWILKYLETLDDLDHEKYIDTFKQLYKIKKIDSSSSSSKVNISNIIEKKKKELERKLNFIYDKYEDETYSKEVFLSRKETVEKELKDLENVMTNTGNVVNEDGKIEKEAVRFKEDISHVLESYNDPDTNKTNRNKLLRLVIDKVYITKIKKGKYDVNIYPLLS